MSAARAHFGLFGLALLVRRSLRQHWVSSAITAVAIGMGCGLVMAVFNIQAQAERAFTGNSIGYDAVLGARGSKLQLVLSSVFHVEQSPGNVGWDVYQQVADHPAVALAVPYALGDNYEGFRIVGTTEAQFTEYRDGDDRPLAFTAGEAFDAEHGGAVLGSFVARQTGLNVGDTFHAFHGLQYDESQQHEETFRVRGVLAPTNTPMDRVIWVPMRRVLHMSGHVLRGAGEVFEPGRHGEQEGTGNGEEGTGREAGAADSHDGHDHAHEDEHADEDSGHPPGERVAHDHGDHDHEAHADEQDHGAHAEEHSGHDHEADADDHAGHDHGHDHDHGFDVEPGEETAFGIPVRHLEFSAIMLKLRGPQVGFYFDETFNRRGKTATFAWPISTVTAEFFGKLGWMTSVLRQVAYLVVLIAAATILASIYNTISERRRQFAILRALGARRFTVFTAVIAECKTIAALGALIGWGVYLVIFSVAATVLRDEVGIVLDPLAYHPVLWLAPLGVIALGGLVGIIPAWKAYATDVATNLVPQT